MRAVLAPALFVAVSTLALAGCTPPADEGSMDADTTAASADDLPPSPLPTPTPTPSPTSTDGLEPVEATDNTPVIANNPNVVFDGGIAPVVIGQPDPPAVLVSEPVLAMDNWLTGGDEGTLTREALALVLETCERIGDRPRECAAKVTARVGIFEAMSEEVAGEAALLLRQCPADRDLADCQTAIEDERYIRDQSIGEAVPNTLAMRQYERVNWSVAIRRTELNVTPGSQTVFEDAPANAPDQSPVAVESAIAFTESTCFELEYDPDAVLVEQDRVCPEFQRGNTPYTAVWRVEPQRSGELQLTVVAIHERDGRTLRSETVPTSPFIIQVDHYLVKILKNLGLWNEVAAAIGALMTAIGGWGIWKLFRRREKTAPPPSEN